MSTHRALFQASFPAHFDTKRSEEARTPTTEETKKSAHPYSIERIKIPDPEYISEVPERLRNKDLPGFPSTILAVGKPGSGKSNLLMNMLLREVYWLKFFDKIYLLGPTVKTDKLFAEIKVPDDQIVTKPAEFIEKLTEWVDAQKEATKNDPKTAPKCLFIFEDITAYRYNGVQNNPEFTRCFTTIRHHKATAYANVHAYSRLERTARINCMHIMVFPVSRSDIKQIYMEYANHYLDEDDFVEMCKFAWTKDEENAKPFLYINMYADDAQRFRKCFTQIIDVSKFEGLGKHLKRKRAGKFDGDGEKNGKRQKKEKKYEGGEDITQPPPPEVVQGVKKEGGVQNEHGPFEPFGRTSVMDNAFMYLK